ncbi:MAG: hypothetical protein N4A47_05385 [Clostridia bacterium]|jgi:hypothetical protein|nr:hypothetical protein [Clostridia bacterium]
MSKGKKYLTNKLGVSCDIDEVLKQANTKINRIMVGHGAIMGTTVKGNELVIRVAGSEVCIEKEMSVDEDILGKYFILDDSGNLVANRMSYNGYKMSININFLWKEGLQVKTKKVHSEISTMGLDVDEAELFVEEAIKYPEIIEEECGVKKLMESISSGVVVETSEFVKNLKEESEEERNGSLNESFETIVFKEDDAKKETEIDEK